MPTQQKPKRWTKANVFKTIFFYSAFHAVFYLLSLLFSSTFMQLFAIQEMGSADFAFNDLYYRVVAAEQFEGNAHFRNEKSVVLINTGSLDRANFRQSFAELLLRLEDYQPVAMAVDHEFSDDTSKAGTTALIEAASYLDHVFFAYAPQSSNMLSLGQKAVVVLPEQVSIRYYSCSDSSLAFCLARKLSDKVQPLAANKKDSFPLHYCSYNRGFSDWQDNIDELYDINFKAVEATAFADPDSLTRTQLQALIKGKALILGHLGSGYMYNEYDVEDKFRVPVDPASMSNRERIMPGPVIHANAIENFLHPEHLFLEPNGFWFGFCQQLTFLLFLMLILFTDVNGLVKKIVLGLLSILSLFLVIKLMHYGVYISMGITLLQLLAIEEIVLILEPYYKKLEKILKIENHETN